MEEQFGIYEIDPCNRSTILFECNHPSEWIKFFLKLSTLLPISFMCVFFIQEYIKTQNHIIKTEILFCISSATYLIIYFWTENAIPYESLNVSESSIYRYNQVPLFFWFLGQAAYVCEIVDLLIFLKIPFAKYIKHVATFLKWVCIFFLVFVTICMLISNPLEGAFFDGLFQRYKRWDSPVFYFIHSLLIVVLASTFIFFPSVCTLFPKKLRRMMAIIIFVYALALALDLISFELSHTMNYYFNLYWEDRNSYLYINVLMQYLYYDFPPLVLSWLVYTIAFPEAKEEDDQNIRDMLSQEFDI